LTELKADPEVAEDISINMVALIELRAPAHAAAKFSLKNK